MIETATADITYGECVVTSIHNVVTGRWETHINSYDHHVLICDEFVERAFNEPNETVFGRILLAGLPLTLFIVINGRNRQVRYKLTKQRPLEHVWEAELVAEAETEMTIESQMDCWCYNDPPVNKEDDCQ